jgi:O-acetyl-ADP-ribose deacetylase (regulator of RNase III)
MEFKEYNNKYIMKIELCIRDKSSYEIAKSIFQDIPDITISFNTITNGIYDTLISAGNSFAEMNGGVDGIINTHLSGYTPTIYIQENVKDYINKYFMGELPVGSSIVIHTSHPRHHRLIYTPTMRVAEDVSKTINAYLAFRSALIIMKNNNISTASAPLLCTGAGCMSVVQACNQMKEAYLSVMQGNLIGKDWPYYHQNHRYLHSFK